MDKKVITEIVSFEINKDVSNGQFVEIVNLAEKDFHMNQNGYIDSELVKGKENKWTIIMHWESLEEVKQASKLMMKDLKTEKFRKVIIPTSVKMTYYEQVQTWSK